MSFDITAGCAASLSGLLALWVAQEWCKRMFLYRCVPPLREIAAEDFLAATLRGSVEHNQQAFSYRGVVVLTHPDDVRSVILDEQRFRKNYGYDFMRVVLGDALVTARRPDEHRKQRIEVSKCFSKSAVALMLAHARKTADFLVERWSDVLRRGGGGAVTTTIRESIHEALTTIIARGGLGLSENQIHAVLRPLQHIGSFQNRFQTSRLLCRFPFFLTELQRASLEKLKEVLRNVDKNSGAPFSMLEGSNEHLCSLRRVLLFAGSDTCSNALQWTLLLLAFHSDAQEHLAAAVVGVDLSDGLLLERVEYLRFVILEGLRLFPPAPVVFRTVARTDGVALAHSQVVLPFRCDVAVSMFALHRSESVYGPEAEKFIPERWRDISWKTLQSECRFIPFSHGQRRCAGQELAMAELSVLVAAIVQRFIMRPVGAFPATSLQFTLSPRESPKVEFLWRSR
jgi:cytochrome P450